MVNYYDGNVRDFSISHTQSKTNFEIFDQYINGFRAKKFNGLIRYLRGFHSQLFN